MEANSCRWRDIEIFHLAQTRVNRDEVQRWLTHLGANNYQIPPEEAATDPALIIALAAKRCYMSFEPGLNPNVTKVRQDLCEYLDNILKSGHGSVLEHSTHTFAFEGVSRVFTGEMNRHRAGWAISEGSMRYIRYRNIRAWLPESLKIQPGDPEPIRDKKLKSLEIFERAFQQDEANYQELVDLWQLDTNPLLNFTQKKHLTSCFRRIIPMGIGTGGVWTGNIRALRHVIAMRADAPAEEEICHVFSRVAKIMLENEPFLFGDFSQTEEGYWKPKYPKV